MATYALGLKQLASSVSSSSLNGCGSARLMYDSDDSDLSLEHLLNETRARDLTYNVFKQGVNGMYHYVPMTVRFRPICSTAMCKLSLLVCEQQVFLSLGKLTRVKSYSTGM
jgi:hypothetical protein